MSAEHLTKTQRRALLAVATVQRRDDVAHDLEGDLSMASGNWPATAASLERRGLICPHFDPYRPPEEAWTYTLTDEGRAVAGALTEGEANDG